MSTISSNTPLYDANDVNFRLQHLRVFELVDMIEGEKLDILQKDRNLYKYLNPWDARQKSLFIESLMLDFPIPAFYLDGSLSRWKIIDGIKRLHAIYEFMSGNFKLTELEYFPHENGKNYLDKDFSPSLRTRIRNAEIIAYIINPGTPLEVRYNIFQRINTAGFESSSKTLLPQSGIKTRNIFFQGKVKNLIIKLNKNEEFKGVVKNIKLSSLKNNKTILRREYISHFIAFQMLDVDLYSGNMEKFLSSALLMLHENFDENREKIETVFNKTMGRMFDLFADNHYTDFPTQQGDILVFDGLTWNLANLTFSEFKKLEQNDERFLNDFQEWLHKKNITSRYEKNLIELFDEINIIINKYIR